MWCWGKGMEWSGEMWGWYDDAIGCRGSEGRGGVMRRREGRCDDEGEEVWVGMEEMQDGVREGEERERGMEGGRVRGNMRRRAVIGNDGRNEGGVEVRMQECNTIHI